MALGGEGHKPSRRLNAVESDVRPSLCRICSSFCPIVVTIENGRPVKISGDQQAPLYEGYSCPKGRALTEQHNSPARLLHSLKRNDQGQFERLPSARAMDEIASKVATIIKRHGPRSVALYFGTGVMGFFPAVSVAASWMESIGSPMMFSATTIDKPGAAIAQAAHGYWRAGHPGFEGAEAWMLIGLNPLISKSGGFPPNNPARRLKDAVGSGRMKLIVIDPRRTETAQRATIHLQAKPGEDPAILAAMIHVIIEEGLYDAGFIAGDVEGFDSLRQAVLPFTPQYAAQRADVPAEQIIEAARLFASASHAGVGCGVGPSFSLTGSITEYLSLALNTICGFWSRPGDRVSRPNVLLPAYDAYAEAIPPFPFTGQGPKLRVRGLAHSAAGMPTGGLADEILLGGEGQIKALFCLGGNPMMAWPDQTRAAQALKSLELLVCADPEMSATARLSHYVMAPKLGLEVPSTSSLVESAKYYGQLRGIEGPYGRYAPAVVQPPEGSDVIADWELYYGLAQRMGLQLKVTTAFGIGQHLEVESQVDVLDMDAKPSDDELITIFSRRSRVPLDMIKRHPHGHIFADAQSTVLPKREGCEARLDVGNAYMMMELAKFLAPSKEAVAPYEFVLLPRRTNRLMNSAGHRNQFLGGLEPTNPAYFHSEDLEKLELSPNDQIRLSSAHGAIVAVVAADNRVRRGCISMTHGFGMNPGELEDADAVGCNVGRLMSTDAEFDPITGIPRMGALPVAVTRLDRAVP